MIKLNQGLHNHSLFCDGKNTLDEMTSQAVRIGFDTIGFSSHSYTDFDLSYCMKDEHEYKQECKRLKTEYFGIIDILIGIEQDYYSPTASDDYDYIIGSVHYVKLRDDYIPIDLSADILKTAASKYCKGDIMQIVKEYYSTVGDIVNKTDCDIIGHFDLITKFSEKYPKLVDTKSSEYIKARDNALMSLIDSGRIFEVNTGAIARGYRTFPYPDSDCLRIINECGGKVIITSDCHNKEQLNFGFENAVRILVANGFKSVYLYKRGSFIETELI